MFFRARPLAGVGSAIAFLVSLGISGCAKVPPVSEGATLTTVDGRSLSSNDLDRYITSEMDSAGVMGLQLAVINRGEVVYTNEYGLKSRRSGLAPDAQTVFGALSFSKTVFAYLVMQLVVPPETALRIPRLEGAGRGRPIQADHGTPGSVPFDRAAELARFHARSKASIRLRFRLTVSLQRGGVQLSPTRRRNRRRRTARSSGEEEGLHASGNVEVELCLGPGLRRESRNRPYRKPADTRTVALGHAPRGGVDGDNRVGLRQASGGHSECR